MPAAVEDRPESCPLSRHCHRPLTRDVYAVLRHHWQLFTETLGCPHTFELHREHLQRQKRRHNGDGCAAADAATAGGALATTAVSDDEVVSYCRASVRPKGYVYEYLRAAQLAVVIGDSLFVHGGLTHTRQLFLPDLSVRYRNLPAGAVPPGQVLSPADTTVAAWVAGLSAFAAAALDEYDAAPGWNVDRTRRGGGALIAWQSTPATGGRTPVVQSYLDRGFVVMPPADVAEWLQRQGIFHVLTGHKPVSDAPLVVNLGGFLEIINADLTRSDGEAGDGRGMAVAEVLLQHTEEDGGTLRRIHGVLRDGRRHDYQTAIPASARITATGGAANDSVGYSARSCVALHVGSVTDDGYWVKAALWQEEGGEAREAGDATVTYLISRVVDRREERRHVTAEELQRLGVRVSQPSASPPL